ncbi:hypothetical protein BDQ12DRAFT_737864 [Crucibulum laeve]|uniref:Uncharacterized protein n=1 Tax=Crucibulum laeve TaxID=68775 RepID=A0A5C3LSG3_9AGAR|nr:hypothetical protein BDQ12DRAFT_737864 [Crucibulum laeve]
MNVKYRIHSLPVELLSDIFLHYLRIKDDSNSPSYLSAHKFSTATPFTLSHVSHTWREITLNYPLLWSSIAIVNPSHWQIPLIRLWIENSGSCPLSISFTQISYDTSALCDLDFDILSPSNPIARQDIEATDTIMALLVTSSHRWRSVHLDLGEYLPQPLKTLHSSSSLPLLQSTILKTKRPSYSCASSAEATLWDVLHLQPSLWSASLSRSDIEGRCPKSLLKRLRNITLYDDFSTEEALDILESCSSIKRLTIHLDNSMSRSPTSPVQQRMLTLSQLHKLELITSINPEPFLASLTLPSLTSISISCYGLKPHTAALAFRSLIERSKCHIQDLALRGNDIPQAEVLIFLSAPTPSVRAIKLETMAITPEILLALTETEDKGPEDQFYFPQLRSLSLASLKAPEWVISQMIKSRLNRYGVAELSSMFVDGRVRHIY